MKKSNLFIGVLFSLLMTMPSYAQKTIVKQKENKTKTVRIQKEGIQKKKTKKMKVLEEKKMEEFNPILEQPLKIEQPLKVKEVQEEVNHDRYFDPITGEWISSGSRPFNENDISITFPDNNKNISFPLNVKGETKKNSRVKVLISNDIKINNVNIGDPKTIFTESDNDGKWKIENFMGDTYRKATYKITAVRIGRGDETEAVNTAAITVYFTPRQQPLGAASSH